jgi:hypothetical protein
VIVPVYVPDAKLAGGYANAWKVAGVTPLVGDTDSHEPPPEVEVEIVNAAAEPVLVTESV